LNLRGVEILDPFATDEGALMFLQAIFYLGSDYDHARLVHDVLGGTILLDGRRSLSLANHGRTSGPLKCRAVAAAQPASGALSVAVLAAQFRRRRSR
jgi:hypothetical protein